VLISFAEWFAGRAYYGVDAVGKVFGDWMSTMTALGGASGVELVQDWAWVYWMRSGKIVRVEIHDDVEKAREIAGVQPS